MSDQNLNSIEEREHPKILCGELIVKLPNNSVDIGGVTTYSNQIININQEIEERIIAGISKEGQVNTGSDKAEREQKGAELLVPSS